VCACEPVLDAELRHVARAEGLRKLTDCTLRVRLGVGACQGAGWPPAAVLADALDWSSTRCVEEVRAFVDERWRAVAPALGGSHLAAMEIHRHTFLAGRGFTS
jgi:glycerol-3-phosphate dehydrogenase